MMNTTEKWSSIRSLQNLYCVFEYEREREKERRKKREARREEGGKDLKN